MTPEHLDTLFPDRREACLKTGLNPDRFIIPTACLRSLTDEQRSILFPSWRAVLVDIRRDVDALMIEGESA